MSNGEFRISKDAWIKISGILGAGIPQRFYAKTYTGYSDFKTFAGFVMAPLITWPLTVTKVIANNMIMGTTNKSHCKPILKAKVSNHWCIPYHVNGIARKDAMSTSFKN